VQRGCDYAPVVMVNWEFYDNMTPQSARTWSTGCAAAATSRRPAAPPAVHLEAGLADPGRVPDDQAAGGHTAGAASLAGLRKAKEQGWTPNGDSR